MYCDLHADLTSYIEKTAAVHVRKCIELSLYGSRLSEKTIYMLLFIYSPSVSQRNLGKMQVVSHSLHMNTTKSVLHQSIPH